MNETYYFDIPIVDVGETTETTTETTTEATTQDLDITYITTEDQPVDTNMYFSAQVSDADINDLYSVALSIRNLLLLFFLFFIFFKVKNIIHVTLTKLFGIGK